MIGPEKVSFDWVIFVPIVVLSLGIKERPDPPYLKHNVVQLKARNKASNTSAMNHVHIRSFHIYHVYRGFTYVHIRYFHIYHVYRGFTHDYPFINIREVQKEMLKTEGEALYLIEAIGVSLTLLYLQVLSSQIAYPYVRLHCSIWTVCVC